MNIEQTCSSIYTCTHIHAHTVDQWLLSACQLRRAEQTDCGGRLTSIFNTAQLNTALLFFFSLVTDSEEAVSPLLFAEKCMHPYLDILIKQSLELILLNYIPCMGPENSELMFALFVGSHRLCKDKVQTEILSGCFKEHNVTKTFDFIGYLVQLYLSSDCPILPCLNLTRPPELPSKKKYSYYSKY